MKQGPSASDIFRRLLYIVILSSLTACKSATIEADNQTIGLYQDTQKPLTLTATTSDNSTPTYEIKNPKYGTLSGTPPELIYTPLESFIGADEFQFVAITGNTKSAPAIIRLVVAPNQALSQERPSPVAVNLAQSYSPTELHLEWNESSDNTTPTEKILYEVHVSSKQNFFPSQETLKATLEGQSNTLLSNMTPGEQIYINIVAVDQEGNRSLETKPASLRMAREAIEFKEGVNLFVTDTKLINPIFNAEAGTITFTATDTEFPAAGDYLIMNPSEDTQIVFVEEVISNFVAASPFAAAAAATSFQIRARPADFREIIASGDINVSAASNEGSTGWRLSEALAEIDSSEIPYIQFEENDETRFSCMDENLDNPRIDLTSPVNNSVIQIAGGIEIGCDINVEINSNYGYAQLPPLSDKEDAVLEGGTIHTTGTVSTKLFGNIGYDAPLLDSLSKKIWASDKPMQRSFKIKVPLGHPLAKRLITLFGINELTVNYSMTPTLNWKYGASKGQDVDIITNNIMSYDFDETITFKADPFLELPYTFERKPSSTRPFKPRFTTNHLFAKANVETEYEFHLDFLFGMRINMTAINKLGVTTGINSRFIAQGETRAREHYDLLSQKIDNVTPYEMKSMSLRYQPSLQSAWAYNIKDYDTYKNLDWWEKMIADTAAGRVLSGSIAEIPLSIDSYILLNIPHYELTRETQKDQHTFTAKLIEDTGTGVGILANQTKWHELTSEGDFVLEPVEHSDPPTAKGRFTPTATRSATVAFEYLPELVKPLLENDPELIKELAPDIRNDFLNGMRKFAVEAVEFDTPAAAYVHCSTGTQSTSGNQRYTAGTDSNQAFIKTGKYQVWSSLEGHLEGTGYSIREDKNSEWQHEYAGTFNNLLVPWVPHCNQGGYCSGTYSKALYEDQPVLNVSNFTPFEEPLASRLASAQAADNVIKYYISTSFDTDYSTDKRIGARKQPSLEIGSNIEDEIGLEHLNCSAVPQGISVGDYLLSLPFQEACNTFKACVKEDLQNRP